MTPRWMPPLVAVIIGLALVAAGVSVGKGLERWRMADRSITVKGLAERNVESDYAVWPLTFRRAGNDFAGVQQALAQDRDRVVGFLKEAGFKPEEIEAEPLRVEDAYAREYAQRDQPLRYGGTGRVLVRSSRVQAVEAAARTTDPLIQAGLQLSGDGGMPSGPRYQLRGFNAVKGPLLAEATQNAREQAQQFAAQAGAELGALKSANQGVISIAGDDGSGGDDGSSRTKRLRVVSTFEYTLR